MAPPPAANAKDAAALADELARYRVIGADPLGTLVAEFPGGDAGALVEFLAARGALTAFQTERVLAGEAAVLALGPYRLTGFAGRGTFGPLFSAVHTSRPEPFSVRVTPLRSLWKARQAKQLARALASGGTHPAVAPLVEVDSANGFHYLVWPLDAGDRLSDAVEDHGPLPPGDVVAVMGHLANALAACHAHGIAHGALTPNCVSLGANGLPRLLELGAGALLAQCLETDESLLDSMSVAFASAGVLAFAAPELALAPMSATPACDQYALGAVGYFALTGLPPYPHPALADQLRAKRSEPPPSVAVVNPEVPADLAAVLERMMAPDPADRFASLAEVEERLAALNCSAAAPVPELPDPVESLLLSRLQKGGERASGAISWTMTGSGVLRPAARDDSDASVTFDLPEAPETVPAASPAHPPGGAECVDTPRTVPPSPRSERSPVPLGDSAMGNRLLGALNDGSRERKALPAPPPPPDPRLSAPVPVQWHSTDNVPPPPAGARKGPPPAAESEPPPAANLPVWKRLRRNVLFWQTPQDTVQVTVFGPFAATPGQTARVTVFLHTPDAAGNVRTLSRAFQHDAEQIGTGFLSCEVARATELAVHVSVANAGVGKTLLKCVWRGQPHRLGFDLHVPWECAEGRTPGLVSVGLDNVRVGKIEFW
ncbi:MAG TPA: hypothetical protein VGE74_22875, partial [Gemmata sp.]